MNPIDFFKEQIAIWNDEQYCDSCWSFGAPLSESAMNLQQLRDGEECCYQLMITDYNSRTTTEYNNTPYPTRVVCDHRLTIYVLKQSRIDINTYNEIDGHSECESKWETIIKPLFDCFACNAVMNSCEILGYPLRITQWDVSKVINYADNVFDGIRITANFREIK